MQDYHIYAHYVSDNGVSKTSPKYMKPQKHTQVQSPVEQQNKKPFMTPKTMVGGSLGVASKINSYVGEITENKITASRRRVGITYAAMVAASFSINPVVGITAAVVYTGDKLIGYEIKQYKLNLSAEFLKDLSGGTVSTKG